MKRGELRLVDFEPSRGRDANKQRPAVIVSNDGANAAAVRHDRGVVTVVPVTSNTKRVYPFQVLLPKRRTGLSVNSKAQAEQIRSIDIARVGPVIGAIPAEILGALDEAIRLHLAL